MGRKRNPDSENQQTMNLLFGESAAAKIPANWRQWPSPQREIYERMLSGLWKFVRKSELDALKATADRLNEVLSEL